LHIAVTKATAYINQEKIQYTNEYTHNTQMQMLIQHMLK